MPTKLLVLASTLISTVAAAPLGCGSLDGHTGTRGTLATVQGGLSNPSGYPVHNDARVAVVWRNLNSGPSAIEYIVSQDLPVQPVFPSSFVVQIDGPPPAAALHVPPELHVPVGEGVVVAYEDLNGNGKLDLVSDDAGAFIDRIVGANEDLILFYIGGPIPPQVAKNQQDFVGTPMPGYNIIRTPKVTCITGGEPYAPGTGGAGSSSGGASSSGAGSSSMAETEAGAPAEAGLTALDGGPCMAPPAEWLPMRTPYDLTVSSDPKINQIMCQNGGASGGGSSGSAAGGWNVTALGTPPGGYPSPTDPGLTCEGSTGYVYNHCTTVQHPICAGGSMTNCMSVQIDLGSGSAPPGWPCP